MQLLYANHTAWYIPDICRYNLTHYSADSDTKMTKLTLQEQMLKAGLVTSKKNGQSSENGEKVPRSGS